MSSPQLYLSQGLEKGASQGILDNAIKQSELTIHGSHSLPSMLTLNHQCISVVTHNVTTLIHFLRFCYIPWLPQLNLKKLSRKFYCLDISKLMSFNSS
ncbi:MAG: hypothetical protein ACJAY7_001688 [Pseudohongiellaceae bacterium]|jgi:hypothetical protein